LEPDVWKFCNADVQLELQLANPLGIKHHLGSVGIFLGNPLGAPAPFQCAPGLVLRVANAVRRITVILRRFPLVSDVRLSCEGVSIKQSHADVTCCQEESIIFSINHSPMAKKQFLPESIIIQ
jgi:hypothetical protein